MYKLVANKYSKTSLPSLKIQFDTDFEQDKFVSHLKKLEFDGINWVAVRGVVDVVRVNGSPDPVTAVADAAGQFLGLVNNVVGLFVAGRNRKDRMERIDVETSGLEPLVEKLFATYPFLRDFYAGRRQGIVDAINNAKGKKKNPFFEQLNSLLKSVIASIQPISPTMQRIELSNDPGYAPTNFEREFADFFAKNPDLLPKPAPSANAPKTNTTNNANVNTNTNTPKTSTNIVPYVFGGLILYSIMSSQSTKKGKSSKSK